MSTSLPGRPSLETENARLRRQNRVLRRVALAALLLAGGTFVFNGIPPGRAGTKEPKPGTFLDDKGQPWASLRGVAGDLSFLVLEQAKTPRSQLDVNDSGVGLLVVEHKRNPRTQLNVRGKEVGLLVAEGTEGIPRTQLGVAEGRLGLLVVEGTKGFPRTQLGMRERRLELIVTENKPGSPRAVVTWTGTGLDVSVEQKKQVWRTSWDGTRLRVYDQKRREVFSYP